MSVSGAPSRSRGVDWQQLDDLFAEAMVLPTDERDAFVSTRCQGDDELAVELRSLLANADTDAPLIDSIAGALAELSRVAPSRVGPYRLGKMIGQGGMGTVYSATRDDDEFERDVAIKVLKPFPSPEHVTRFRDERQILATLDHPAIVRLLDGGSTDGGYPYLVMEHVRGVPITQWAKDRSVRERVELIARVAAGVGYAHGRLVVHRDLKPSNLLVDDTGSPKLLDFGIAKLLAGDRETPDTRTGLPLLTPEYASPEQARGEPITVATDIYSLGAVFYEVLAGKPPQTPGASVLDTLAAICVEEPPRPGISRDLDSIVLKMLQKKSSDRYASMVELIADLERFLDGRPVKARTASVTYRAGKFVTRNAGKLAIAAVVGGALVAAAVISVGQARRATEAAKLADAERNKLVFERGWQELAAGHPNAALPWLVRALEGEDSPVVRFSIAEAMRPLDQVIVEVSFLGGAQSGAWLDDDRFALWGRGGFAMFDRAGHPIGTPITTDTWAMATREDVLVLAHPDRVSVRGARDIPTNGPSHLGILADGTMVIGEHSGRLRLLRGDRAIVDKMFPRVTSLATSDDRIAIGDGDGVLHVLDTTGRELFSQRAHDDRGIGAVRFVAGGRVVSAGTDAKAKMWSAAGELLATFAAHNTLISTIAVDRSGMRIATGGRDGTVKVWSLDPPDFVVGLRGHELDSMADFSPDGTRVLTSGSDNTHRIWTVLEAQLEFQIEGRLGSGTGSSATSNSRGAFYSPGGDVFLAIAGTSAKIVRTNRGALLAEIDTGRGRTQPRAAMFSPDEREIAIAGLGQLEVWTRDGNKLVTVPVGEILIWDVAWSPDGKQLAYAGNHAALVDRATLTERRLAGHPGRVNRVQFSRDGSRLLTAGDQTARIWDVASATQLAHLDHPARVIVAIWDRANTRIYTSCSDGKLRIWDASNYAQLDEIEVGTRYLDLALAPDQRRLALGGHDGTIAIWDLESRTRVVELLGHTGPVTAVVWSSDGALLASSADDQTARVWDPQGGKLLATRRHRDGAMSVAWTKDDRSLLTASTDGSVRLWDAHRDTRSSSELRAVVDQLR